MKISVVGVAAWGQGTPEGVEDNGSLTRVAAFPIGIDPERFAMALEEDAVRTSIEQLRKNYQGRKVAHHCPFPIQGTPYISVQLPCSSHDGLQAFQQVHVHARAGSRQ